MGASAITLSGKGTARGVEVPFREWISDACIGCGACDAICPTECIEMEARKIEQLRKLPVAERPCRYALMGLMNGAVCANNYECATCEVDQRIFEACHPEHPIFAARDLLPVAGYMEIPDVEEDYDLEE